MGLVKGSMNVLDSATNALLGKGTKIQYFGKFRAYLFANFGILALVCAAIAFVGVTQGEFYMLSMLLFAAAFGFVSYLLWKGVAKKVPEAERKTIFKIFCMTSILVFGKVLLCCTVILIPFALAIGGAYDYQKYVVTDEYGRQKVMYLRYNKQGDLIDSSGNKYA